MSNVPATWGQEGECLLLGLERKISRHPIVISSPISMMVDCCRNQQSHCGVKEEIHDKEAAALIPPMTGCSFHALGLDWKDRLPTSYMILRGIP